MTAPQGGTPPPSKTKQATKKGGSLFKKLVIGGLVLLLLCCTPCGAIAFVAGFSGTNSIISLLMQNECPDSAQGGSVTAPGNVDVPDIKKNPPPALAGKSFPSAGGGTANYDADEVRNAWITLDVAKQHGLSEKGILIAFVTAVKESHFHNYLKAVDHDSLGIYQQRPSQGWGTPEQITDPWYASNTFITRMKKVPDWENKQINEVGEAVQRSAVKSPEAYNKHITEAQAVLAYLGNPVAGVPVSPGATGGKCAGSVVGGLRAQIVYYATQEIGEKPAREDCALKYSNNCPMPWCAAFVQWVWGKAGVTPLFTTFFADGVAWGAIHQGLGTWKPHTMGTRDGNPLPGDALIYGPPARDHSDYNGKDVNGHIGIVVKVHPDGLIDTIEGNTGNDQVSYNTKLDPATLYNGNKDSMLSGYVAPPGG